MLNPLSSYGTALFTQVVNSQSSNLSTLARTGYRLNTAVPEDRLGDYVFRDWGTTLLSAALMESGYRLVRSLYTYPMHTADLELNRLEALYPDGKDEFGRPFTLNPTGAKVTNVKNMVHLEDLRGAFKGTVDSRINPLERVPLQLIRRFKEFSRHSVADQERYPAILHHLRRRLDFDGYLCQLQDTHAISEAQRQQVSKTLKKHIEPFDLHELANGVFHNLENIRLNESCQTLPAPSAKGAPKLGDVDKARNEIQNLVQNNHQKLKEDFIERLIHGKFPNGQDGYVTSRHKLKEKIAGKDFQEQFKVLSDELKLELDASHRQQIEAQLHRLGDSLKSVEEQIAPLAKQPNGHAMEKSLQQSVLGLERSLAQQIVEIGASLKKVAPQQLDDVALGLVHDGMKGMRALAKVDRVHSLTFWPEIMLATVSFIIGTGTICAAIDNKIIQPWQSKAVEKYGNVKFVPPAAYLATVPAMGVFGLALWRGLPVFNRLGYQGQFLGAAAAGLGTFGVVTMKLIGRAMNRLTPISEKSPGNDSAWGVKPAASSSPSATPLPKGLEVNPLAIQPTPPTMMTLPSRPASPASQSALPAPLPVPTTFRPTPAGISGNGFKPSYQTPAMPPQPLTIPNSFQSPGMPPSFPVSSWATMPPYGPYIPAAAALNQG